jgi:hypothetical protein
VVIELADRTHQPVAGVREQPEMKLAIDALPLAQIMAGERLHAPKAAAEHVDVALGESRHVDAYRERLVNDAHRVELLEVVDRKRRHAAAAVDFGLDEPFALQHAHRFAQRSAADAELARELDLRQ